MHWIFWLWYQLHIVCFICYMALIFLERCVSFQKLIQLYTIMSSIIKIWNIWISTKDVLWISWQSGVFLLTVVCLLFKVPFMLLLWATNSFCSYHWILMSVYIDQWRAVIGLFYANVSCISVKWCRCMFIGHNSKIIIFIFC